MTQLKRWNRGFTLVEVITAISILVAIFGIISFSVIGIRQKAILIRDTDLVFDMLEFARQQSLLAYKGEAYSVVFTENNKVRVQPGTQSRQLSTNLELSITPETSEVLFEKLNGKTDSQYVIKLKLGKYIKKINVEKSGLISQSKVMIDDN